ncbi:unnamed protein product [Lepeophtheirus salmonis]|uniref:(salmon louse) hypothetical protein n=1 Tax=Lepeophtheirus salmonis TaxID=72036 RepID=A0A7R8HCU9_LEPSM|nr:unnamed protein product [Lepeophtheirus salmonis]CAF3008698.1 unnamed protein product [Lepeophtheirus salmonis]
MKEDEGGLYPLTRISLYKLHLPRDEETVIALKIWYPSTPEDDSFFPGSDGERESLKDISQSKYPSDSLSSFPAILEYIPYRHSDFTVQRDESRHPWMASHGYVVVRADLRGSGDSNGLYFDEYTEIEQEDGVDIIEWLKKQSWCNGRIGMYGKSWGGFNGLQIAFREPSGLASVISIYSTDNRYTDDIHYKGGCVIGSGMLSWASWMFADQAKPPHPKHSKDWKLEWKRRLENACHSWADIWLSKQKFHEYWENGSICMNYEKIKIPVFVIGGWVDSYKNAAFRMSSKLPLSQCLIGPWSHDWPDTALPKPNIGFLQKCLEFWERTLKNSSCDVEKDFVWYQCKGVLPPSELVNEWPGEWLRMKKGITLEDSVDYLHFEISSEQPRISQSRGTPRIWSLDELTESVTLKVDPLSAQEYSEFLSFGDPDQAGDMSLVNSKSFRHMDTGAPSLEKNLSPFLDNPFLKQFIGVLNLEDDLDKRRIKITLDVLGYDLQPGHQLSLSLSPMYFPLIWPPNREPHLQFYGGILSIPKLLRGKIESNYEAGEPICFKRGPIIEKIKDGLFKRSFDTLFNEDKSETYEWRTLSDSGTEKLIEQKITSSEKREEIYRISNQFPFNPQAIITWDVNMEFPSSETDEFERISIKIISKMSSSEENFLLDHHINVSHGETEIYQNGYEKVIPREL